MMFITELMQFAKWVLEKKFCSFWTPDSADLFLYVYYWYMNVHCSLFRPLIVYAVMQCIVYKWLISMESCKPCHLVTDLRWLKGLLFHYSYKAYNTTGSQGIFFCEICIVFIVQKSVKLSKLLSCSNSCQNNNLHQDICDEIE